MSANGKKEAKQQASAEEMKREMLRRLLDTAALERLANVRMVKPDKAAQVEEQILSTAKQGQDKISESQIKNLLFALEEPKPTTKITFQRKGAEDSDDDESYLEDL
eukprot:gb/GEZN01025958.1/.p1 GENE.gb/GEZN01025958.1/~~gb/GEZN01025958.1/.p1  ORF type:complete len:106 (+),score=35.16 gb/GEZN01025958.1/:192-509(+)